MLTTTPLQHYDLLTNVVGRRILDLIPVLMTGVIKRRLNSERLIVFPVVILRRKKGVEILKDIHWHLLRFIDIWERM